LNDAPHGDSAALAVALHKAGAAMPDDLVDAVAMSLAAGAHQARAAARLRAEPALWPRLPLAEALECLDVATPGAAAAWRGEASRTLAAAADRGYRALWPAHPDYPPLLAEVIDPPLLLWADGHVEYLTRPCVALVGSRRATTAGREVAARIAAELAGAGVVVVSGFALGIDAAAHRGALTRGATIAVLGCGLDCPYPADHASLRTEVAGHGLRVSEFPPSMEPRPHHFPMRNRTISGLCAAVVVVQATERSGSLITARLALEQGREVIAVPGDVRTGGHAGCHALIRDGARLVERAADVLEELGWGPQPVSGPASADAGELGLLLLLRREAGMTLDDLVGATGRKAGDLLGELLDLELAGLVRRDLAGWYLPSERKW